MDGYIEPSGGASFTNAAAQPSTPQTNGYFLVAGDSSTLTFNNAGTFNAQAGAGHIATDDGVTFTSSGSVSVASGTLYLDDPGGRDTGSFKVAKGATLDFDETAATLTSTSSTTGAGTVLISGSASPSTNPSPSPQT